jgi:hypothetical protein
LAEIGSPEARARVNFDANRKRWLMLHDGRLTVL